MSTNLCKLGLLQLQTAILIAPTLINSVPRGRPRHLADLLALGQLTSACRNRPMSFSGVNCLRCMA